VHVVTGADEVPCAAAAAGPGRWTAPGAEVTAHHDPGGALRVVLHAPATDGLSTVALRWRHHPGGCRPALVLGDAWERSYGGLQCRGIQPEAPVPTHPNGRQARARDASPRAHPAPDKAT
jgi:alpha-galactosidase